MSPDFALLQEAIIQLPLITFGWLTNSTQIYYITSDFLWDKSNVQSFNLWSLRGGLCSMISTWMRTCPLFGVFVSIWNIFAHKSLSFWWPFESWWFDNLNLCPCKICEMFCYSLFDQTIDEQISKKMNFVTSKQDEKTLRKR